MTILEKTIIASLFFLTMTLVVVALVQIKEAPLRARLREVGKAPLSSSGTADAPDKWFAKLVSFSANLGATTVTNSSEESLSSLRVSLSHAGFRSGSAPAVYIASKILCAIFLFATSQLVVVLIFSVANHQGMMVLLAAISVALGYLLPGFVVARLTTVRKRALVEALPNAVDLLGICIEAGLGMDAALIRVKDELQNGEKFLKQEFDLLILELRAGAGRSRAWQNLAVRTGVEEFETLAGMVIQADRFGTSIADALRIYTENLRIRRRLRAEELAAKLATKLLFPLVLFIFPTLFVVLIGPAAMEIARGLAPVVSQANELR